MEQVWGSPKGTPPCWAGWGSGVALMPVDMLQLFGLISYFFFALFSLHFANTTQVQGLGEEGASMGEPSSSQGLTLCFSHHTQQHARLLPLLKASNKSVSALLL